MEEYIEDHATLGELVLLHEWMYDRTKNIEFANRFVDQLEEEKLFTTFDKFEEVVNKILIKKLLERLESIKASCDF